MAVSTSKEPARIAGMFDSIARRYDTLNHLLSLGLDRHWRKRAVRELHLTGRERVLDMCTGTADLAVEAVAARPGARDVIGVDFAGEMLRFAGDKLKKRALSSRVRLARGDAMQLPLADASVDAAMVGFGIRNVSDYAAAARECHRVLRPGGQFAILEFGFPEMPVIKQLYRFYFRAVLPRVGRAVSKHGEAYDYLPASVSNFPAPEKFAEVLRTSGFSSVRHISLTFGVVYLYMARK